MSKLWDISLSTTFRRYDNAIEVKSMSKTYTNMIQTFRFITSQSQSGVARSSGFRVFSVRMLSISLNYISSVAWNFEQIISDLIEICGFLLLVWKTNGFRFSIWQKKKCQFVLYNTFSYAYGRFPENKKVENNYIINHFN